jgi:hypothetical protein
VTATDVDDTTGCPTRERCGSCSGTRDLAVCTVDTAVGVYCLTLCADCIHGQRVPEPASWADAIERVLDHCDHLGVTVDQMAALRRAKGDI